MSVGSRRAARLLDVGALLAVLVLSAGAWWPTRNLPYYWDGASFVDSARDVLHARFHSIIQTHSSFAHPPLFLLLVAAAWRACGESRFVAHAVVLPFLPAAMIALYGLGRRLHGRLLGFGAALVFAAIPLVQFDLGAIYCDLPIASLTACALLAWATGRRRAAGVLFAAAALMKIPAVVAPAALLPVVALSDRRRDCRVYEALLLPLLGVAAWLVYHRHVTGWWLSVAGRPSDVPDSARAVAEHAAALSAHFFAQQGRWTLLAAAGLGAALLLRRREPVVPPELVPSLAVIVGGFLFISSTNEFLDRYTLVMMPAYVLAGLLTLRRALVRPEPFAALIIAILFCMARAWHPSLPRTSRYEVTPNTDLAYLDMIRIGRAAASYVAAEHGDAEIYGGFHELYQLREPWQGYVEKPLDVRPCRDFEPRTGVEQIVYIHAYELQQMACRELVSRIGAVPLRRFQSKGKWIEIWRAGPP